MSLNNLLKFREAYLRAVAQAWHQHDFFCCLVNDPIAALAKFGFQWPWGNICDLAMQDARDTTAWLCDAWVTSQRQLEMLRLHLPLVPRLVALSTAGKTLPLQPTPDLLAMALADYYRQRAVLFSDDTVRPAGPETGTAPAPELDSMVGRGGRSPVGGVTSAYGTPEPPYDPVIGLGSQFPIGGFTPAHNTFESFKVVIMAAIAEAWRNPEYKCMLEIDAAAALRRIRDYRLPWGFRLVVADDRATSWCPPTSTPSGIESGWHNCTNHQLTLIVPRPPEVASQPVALAAYNAAGAAYPFTCCL